jgi:uncharacterized protein with FMN-binding domain
MKKLLLSFAVIAASGAYVAYQDHGGAQPTGLALAATDMPLSGQPAPEAPKPKAAVSPTSDRTPIPPTVAPDSTLARPPSPQINAETATSPADASASMADNVASARPASQSLPITPVPAQKARPDPTASAEVVPLPLPRPPDAPQPDSVAAIAPIPDNPPAQEVSTQTIAQAQSGYRNGTYKGVSANAYYGRVQVEAVISNGHLASIRMLDYPRDRRRSLYIAQRSLPVLEREAISAQSAKIDTVSGATLTSEAFMRSLDSALSSARTRGSNA